MASAQGTSRHTCHHCEAEVLTVNGSSPRGEMGYGWCDTTEGEAPRRRLHLKHSTRGVREAASSGCPFFALIWARLDWVFGERGIDPELAMDETSLWFEFTVVKIKQTPIVDARPTHDGLVVSTRQQPSREHYDITLCDVIYHTPCDDEWDDGENASHTFTALFDWDDPSANHVIAGLVDGHTGSDQAVGQVQRRLQYCLAHHDNCKAAYSDIRPRRFVLVGDSAAPNVKVVQAQKLINGDGEPYAALSYCWGQDQVLTTTSANSIEMETGFPFGLLPKTIADAVRVTRKLGIKLLWVDSLCLVQDGGEELVEEIARMHHYYGNAHITLSAAVAGSCTEGFLQEHPKPRQYQLSRYGRGHYLPVDLGVPEKTHLKLVHPDDLHEHNTTDSRAWTLQEALLSHRLASFGSRIIRWSCRTESYGVQTDGLRYLRPGPPEGRGLHRALAAARGPIGRLSERQFAFLRVGAWWDVVENYTRRRLSDKRDKLPAVAGVASVLSPNAADLADPEYQLGFLAGLAVHYPRAHPPTPQGSAATAVRYRPRDHFESFLFSIQLLWGADGYVSDPGDRKYWANARRRRRRKQKSQTLLYIAPTWSWANNLGPVVPGAGTLDEDVFGRQLDQETLDGFSLSFWEEGLRIEEVSVALSSSRSPLGAVDGATLTTEGYIFRYEDENDICSVWLDDPVMQIGDYEGPCCLHVAPNLNIGGPYRGGDYPRWMSGRVHGIVLEPVGPDGEIQSDEGLPRYRRIGHFAYKGKARALSRMFGRMMII